MDTEERTKRTHKALSHSEFYAACECLKKNKQQFLDARPSYPQAAELLSKLLGFPVSKNSVCDIRKATGIEWEARKTSSNPNSIRGNAIRTITVSLYRIYRKLGEEIPETLAKLYESTQTHKQNGQSE